MSSAGKGAITTPDLVLVSTIGSHLKKKPPPAGQVTWRQTLAPRLPVRERVGTAWDRTSPHFFPTKVCVLR